MLLPIYNPVLRVVSALYPLGAIVLFAGILVVTYVLEYPERAKTAGQYKKTLIKIIHITNIIEFFNLPIHLVYLLKLLFLIFIFILFIRTVKIVYPCYIEELSVKHIELYYYMVNKLITAGTLAHRLLSKPNGTLILP